MSETTYDLNCEIAELLGWTDLEMDSYWLDDYDDCAEITCWFGIRPSDQGDGYRRDRRPLPSWDSDLNAAMPLYQEWLKASNRETIETKNWFDKTPEQIANAMALTWLFWRKAKKQVYGEPAHNAENVEIINRD